MEGKYLNNSIIMWAEEIYQNKDIFENKWQNLIAEYGMLWARVKTENTSED